MPLSMGGVNHHGHQRAKNDHFFRAGITWKGDAVDALRE
jgi:hypothetical protein